MYPRTHRVLTVEHVSRYSLLYTWQGKDPELKPVLLMSHQDVVPVEAAAKRTGNTRRLPAKSPTDTYGGAAPWTSREASPRSWKQ